MATDYSIQIDRCKALADEPETGHNRWHPDITPILRVAPGDVVLMETRDALDGMITGETKAGDLSNLDMGRVHPLTGPIFVEGAEPGDILEVRILEVRPQPFGFTVLIPGFGILREYFSDPFVAVWRISDGAATSDQLPNVRIPGAPFMGVIGVAPSHELVQRAQAREADVMKRGGMALPPSPDGAVPANEPVRSTGLRTIPPRENGGNIDIRHLTAGAVVYLPVFVPGALFSAGDAHFAQGDGESCGTAIEIGAVLRVQFGIQKKSANPGHMRGPQYTRCGGLCPPAAGQGQFYATTGMPITANDRNESENVTLAAQNALLSMIDYIVMKYAFTREQAYVLTSVSVDLHISELVDAPNVLVSAFLPTHIFDAW